MAFTTMHFGVGMACGGAAALSCALIRRKGFKSIGPAMTLGGLWAIVPDLPRVFVWFPSLPFSGTLGGSDNENRLLSDVFFFHATLDAQPKDFTLLGLAIIILLYNVVILTPLAIDFAKRPRFARLWRRLRHARGTRERPAEE
ncbi:hypothetical protein [Stieleria mannarensis]|uniref:hypothetical protein n=1 Tax=Stieleria mannarensis TaxID=2755585 RepID=UPI00160267E9|nr:hypothetical protein [Rhodopirellula sp. JC639]